MEIFKKDIAPAVDPEGIGTSGSAMALVHHALEEELAKVREEHQAAVDSLAAERQAAEEGREALAARVEALERDLGKPVFSANMATKTWALVRSPLRRKIGRISRKSVFIVLKSRSTRCRSR